jgi:hypothetical protein
MTVEDQAASAAGAGKFHDVETICQKSRLPRFESPSVATVIALRRRLGRTCTIKRRWLTRGRWLLVDALGGILG